MKDISPIHTLIDIETGQGGGGSGGADAETTRRLVGAEIWNSLTGTIIGGAMVIVGMIIGIGGATGTINLGLKFGGLSADLSNATPGVALIFLGVVLMVVYRLKATIRAAKAHADSTSKK